MKRAALFVAVSLFVATEADAGPWTRSYGEAYLKVSGGVFKSDSFVGADGVVVGGADHTSITAAAYGEVGIWEDLHLVAYLPYVVGINDYETSSFLSAGGGDLIAGLQWTPDWFVFPHAFRADVKLPMYDVAPRPTRSPSHPLFGDGQLDVTLWLSAGDSFSVGRLPMYAFVEAGHRFRTEAFVGDGVAGRSFADSFVFNGQIGATMVEITVAANATGVVAYKDELDRLTKSYVDLGGQVYALLFDGLALEASIAGTVWATNSAPGVSIIAGVSYNLR